MNRTILATICLMMSCAAVSAESPKTNPFTIPVKPASEVNKDDPLASEYKSAVEDYNPFGSSNQSAETKADVVADDFMKTVVSNLDPTKQEALKKSTGVVFTSKQTDDFGRPLKTTPLLQLETNSGQKNSFELMVEQMKKKFKPVQRYKPKQGDNITVPAAKFILNAIRTSYEDIEIRSSDSNVVTKIEGGFVYFTTKNNAPFNLIMWERGVPESQISVTIWPLPVMPTMIDLKIILKPETKKKIVTARAERKEETVKQEERIRDMESELKIASQPDYRTSPYQDRIDSLLSVVAANDIPPGFELVGHVPAQVKNPCRFGIYAEAKQRMISSRQIIDVVHVKNNTSSKVVLREKNCWTSDEVIATAILNIASLNPGDETEVYLIRDRLYQERRKQRSVRPSLVK
ncbi:hypothetical protein [Enterovibrio norvegicus]|uniref:hypothetical protein n=1 Tax=Enterovibrio norvegicus TaxID=188144 RepID=UPI00352C505A